MVSTVFAIKLRICANSSECTKCNSNLILSIELSIMIGKILMHECQINAKYMRLYKGENLKTNSKDTKSTTMVYAGYCLK